MPYKKCHRNRENKLDIPNTASSGILNRDDSVDSLGFSNIEINAKKRRGGSDLSEDELNTLTSGDDAVVEFFAYLMINYNDNQKIHTHIGKSRDPKRKLVILNSVQRSTKKNTKVKKPTWELALIIGPFKRRDEVNAFCQEWKDKKRGIKSRTLCGRNMAARDGYTCWDVEKNEKGDNHNCNVQDEDNNSKSH